MPWDLHKLTAADLEAACRAIDQMNKGR